ncbi:hypothetical protein POX_g08996 [Penicillium oxalicum]|uniref:Uncharacterized protein n=1 Tax=Penicillium oxalicum (strain 114-2 / CGMCC 5302) TaxID=933388 RepID=S8AXP1_PENO1|nr:hypothetical protein POX_g08996 [Penicillium oxalicum]EPS26702.1 hypothetical protein PDE_01640 [Penicillium oxalicum 114-2]KAI2786608.1 hypothetical protein POX_g08996 [Penicillium oxalicum]
MDTGVDRWTDVEGGIHIQRNLRLSRPFWDKDGGEDQNDDETRQMDRIREWQHWLKHGNLREQSTEYKISAPVCSLHTRLSNTIVKYPLLQSVLRWVDRPRRKRGQQPSSVPVRRWAFKEGQWSSGSSRKIRHFGISGHEARRISHKIGSAGLWDSAPVQRMRLPAGPRYLFPSWCTEHGLEVCARLITQLMQALFVFG